MRGMEKPATYAPGDIARYSRDNPRYAAIGRSLRFEARTRLSDAKLAVKAVVAAPAAIGGVLILLDRLL